MLLQHMICNRFGHLVTLTCESGLSEGAVKDNIDFQVTIISSIPDRGVYSGRTLFGVVHCPLVIPGLLTAIGVQQGNPYRQSATATVYVRAPICATASRESPC